MYNKWECNWIRKNRGQQDILRVFRSLEKNEEWAKLLLIWIQNVISSGQLRDPEKRGLIYLSVFLKKDEYISKPYELLLPNSLCKLESVFAGITYMPKNLLKFNTYAREALRHSPDNHVSSSDKYTIVNYRKQDQPYNQASLFNIFDKN